MSMDDRSREAGRSFAERHAAKRTKSQEEVADWITGRGQLVIGLFCLAVIVLLAVQAIASVF